MKKNRSHDHHALIAKNCQFLAEAYSVLSQSFHLHCGSDLASLTFESQWYMTNLILYLFWLFHNIIIFSS